MARGCKRKKKESCEKRSPLQNLNGLPINTPISRKISNLSSSAAAVSTEASSSSSRLHLAKKSKTFSKSATNEPTKSTADKSKLLFGSKENEMPRKPFLQKSKKNQPRCLTQGQYWKSNAKPIYRNCQRSKLSSVRSNPGNKLNKGSQEFQGKMKNSEKNGTGIRDFDLANNSYLNCAENCSPVGRATVVEDLVCDRDNCNSVKTPPVEASLSPEIQSQSHSKKVVLKLAATPVSYGAGHLVSGVTDKRKCRRRGSLRGGPAKANVFDSDENVSIDLQESSIPLLAEASVRWLSPRDEGHEDHELDQCKLDLLSSNSMLCGDASVLLCGESSCNGSDSVGNMINKMREPSNYNMDKSLLANSRGISSREGIGFSKNLILDNPTLSIGSLSGGNVIQTPNSDSSSYELVGTSRLDVHGSNLVWPELDTLTKTLDRVNLSPRSEIGLCFPDRASPPRSVGLQKNVDSVSSWTSDATIDNLKLSQMRISWRDGLASRFDETDEFDCCCFFSDEEIDADESASSVKETYMGLGSGENKENDLRVRNDLSQMHLDYEHCTSAGAKEKSLSCRHNTSAESICTDGGGLVASDDSDWTYFGENHMFQLNQFK